MFAESFDAAQPTGCTSSGCHGGTAGGFTFTDAHSLWTTSVNVRATVGGGLRVVPGEPDQSELYLRLLPSATNRMPQGGPYLDDAAISRVAAWICSGAPEPAVVLPPALALSSFAPTTGAVGTLVTLTGSGFSTTPTANAVSFNGTAAEVTSATATQLEVLVPTGATTGKISVTVGSATVTSSGSFTVQAGNPVPRVTALSPCGAVAGAAGFTLTISGSGFLPESTITFRGTALTVASQTATTLTATVPNTLLATATADDSIPVVVSNPAPGGGASAPFTFGIATAVSTLSADVQPIFTATCLGSGCHGGAQSPLLTSGNSATSLIGKLSSGCSGRLLVMRCGPLRTQSDLVDKITSTTDLEAVLWKSDAEARLAHRRPEAEDHRLDRPGRAELSSATN